jgi:hypothetical protein
MDEHRTREAEHAELFQRVAPEAFRAQDSLFEKMANAHAARRKHWETHEPPREVLEKDLSSLIDKSYDQRGAQRTDPSILPAIRKDSRVAKAMTLQPVRDIVINGIVMLSEDRKLDFIGPRYPNTWTSKSGNAFPALQSVWADANDGTFGFDHEVNGTVTGVQANSGAGIYVQFVPLIAPGIAQVRPYASFLYQWASISFKSREDNQATLGIRIWSWDLTGGDFFTEQDHRYFVWNDTIISSYFGVSNSPSWTSPGPESQWDDDHAFLFGTEAPYFRTRPGRVYMAAIWCFGMCWSVSRQNRPGGAIGRLRAEVPFVVVGYQ